MARWKETKCRKCKIQRSKPICNSCRDYNKFLPMTNVDRIHSMNIEELAEFLKDVKADYQWANPDYPSEDDSVAWVEWLQSEVEE